MKNNKIILSSFDSINHPIYGGGGALAIHEVAKRLVQNNRVKIITSKYYRSVNDETIDGVEYHRIGWPSKYFPKLSQIIYSLCLPFHLIQNDFDIWIESFTPPFSTGLLPLFTKKPVVGLVHMLSGEDMKRKYKLPFDLIEAIGLKVYKNFIVLSISTETKIRKTNKKAKIQIIGNGVANVNTKNNQSRYALFMGRIEINQKGLDLLLKSWKKVSGKLVIAGVGPEYPQLKQMIIKENLTNKVRLVGRVSGMAKDKLFKNCSFVVVPSRFETYPIVVLEAFSYGIPVLGYKIDGLAWAPNKAVQKIHPFDTNSYAEACNVLFLNTLKRKEMGNVGKLYAKKHTWDRVASEYESFIQTILK